MKQYVLLFAAALVLAGHASADVCSGLPVSIFSGAATSPVFSAASFSCGGLQFSNFIGIDGGNNPTPALSLTAGSFSSGAVSLTFNPLLAANQDLYLFFTVTGTLSGVGSTVGGSGATVTEQACSSPIATGTSAANLSINPANNCSAGTNLLGGGLNALVNSSGGAANSINFTTTSQTTYIFKDIGTSGQQSKLDSATQAFQTGAIPEPLSMTLIGSGLAVLGVLGKKRRSTQIAGRR